MNDRPWKFGVNIDMMGTLPEGWAYGLKDINRKMVGATQWVTFEWEEGKLAGQAVSVPITSLRYWKKFDEVLLNAGMAADVPRSGLFDNTVREILFYCPLMTEEDSLKEQVLELLGVFYGLGPGGQDTSSIGSLDAEQKPNKGRESADMQEAAVATGRGNFFQVEGGFYFRLTALWTFAKEKGFTMTRPELQQAMGKLGVQYTERRVNGNTKLWYCPLTVFAGPD